MLIPPNLFIHLKNHNTSLKEKKIIYIFLEKEYKNSQKYFRFIKYFGILKQAFLTVFYFSSNWEYGIGTDLSN